MSPPKICCPVSGFRSTAFRFPGPVQRTKNLSADPVLATRLLSHYFKSGASFAPRRSGCQRFIFVFQPLALPAFRQAFRRTGREGSGVRKLRKYYLQVFCNGRFLRLPWPGRGTARYCAIRAALNGATGSQGCSFRPLCAGGAIAARWPYQSSQCPDAQQSIRSLAGCEEFGARLCEPQHIRMQLVLRKLQRFLDSGQCCGS